MSDATVQVDPRPAAPSVAQLLLHYLQLEQATTLFGVPGAAVMHLLNELRTQRNTFRYIVARHETGAAYMADGYARVSGRPGVVLVTSGPGATNALTGSMNAQAGGVPLLTLTGEVPEAYFGKGYLQEGADAGLNVDTIYGNATGYSAIATNPANFQTLFEQALRDALGRPARAAHLSLPDDVAAASLPDARWPGTPRQYRSLATGVDGAGLEAAFQALTQARRPLVYVGSGCREALRGGGLARFTALAQRESDLTLPADLDGHPLPTAPKTPADSMATRMPFNPRLTGYADLVENRVASGHFFQGRCAAWFRLRRPLVEDEAPTGYQRVAVAADSGNGLSSVLDWSRFSFVNADLTINLLRRPLGEWICVDARTLLSPNGCGLAESQLFDEAGLIGRATQTLAVRARS